MDNFEEIKNNLKSIPEHVAIIMDGNRRWAKEQGIATCDGHKAGGNKLSEACKWCIKYGVKELSVYALSVKNLQRSKEELNFLFSFIKQGVKKEKLEEAKKSGVKICLVGDLTLFPEDTQELLKQVENFDFGENYKLKLNICVCYDGRREIFQTAKKLALDVKNGKIEPENIDETIFEKYMYKQMKPVDLLIRTSGEMRLSGFLLWQASYAELYFCDKYWPAFDEKDFLLALYNFGLRIRRYGK